MLLRRSDLGTFRYPDAVPGQTTTRPHALQRFTPFSGAAIDYLYTANGNLRQASGGKYRKLEYTRVRHQSSISSDFLGSGSMESTTWRCSADFLVVARQSNNSVGM